MSKRSNEANEENGADSDSPAALVGRWRLEGGRGIPEHASGVISIVRLCVPGSLSHPHVRFARVQRRSGYLDLTNET